MKTWKRIVGAALTLALYNGCTVTVGQGNDDSDDVDFSDKTEDPETTDDDESTTDDDESTTDDNTTKPDDTTADTSEPNTTTDDATTEPGDTSEPNQSTSEPTSSSTGDQSTSEPDTTDEQPVGACPAEPEAGSCDACVVDSCEADWEACCASEGCFETWTAIYSCVVNNPSDDPWADFDDCAAGASESGDQLDLPAEVQNLAGCVNAPYMGNGSEDPDWGRVDGDGTCTLPCYNVASLDQ